MSRAAPRQRLTDAQAALVVTAESQARALARRLPDAADGAPFEALCLLAQSFDPERHPSFDGYVRVYLRRRTIDLLRRERGRRGQRDFHALSLDAPAPGADDDLGEMLASLEPTPEEVVIDLREPRPPSLRDYVACLAEPNRSLLLAKIADTPVSQTDLAARLGVTPSRISQRIGDAMDELRDLMLAYPAGPPGSRQRSLSPTGRNRRRRCLDCREALPPQYGRGRPATRCPHCRAA